MDNENIDDDCCCFVVAGLGKAWKPWIWMVMLSLT